MYKKIFLKTITIIVYISILLLIVGFDLSILFDFKMIFMMVFGSTLLSLGSYNKSMSRGDLLPLVKWNIQITGYLTTFVFQFALLSGNYNPNTLLYDVALNCRPLLYSLFLLIIVQNFFEIEKEEKSDTTQTDKTSNKNQIKEVSCEEQIEIPSISEPKKEVDINALLKTYGLTQREVDVAAKILLDLSNKEIGEELFISENTVKKHTYNIFKKLDISNREQLKTIIKGDGAILSH